MNGPDDETDVVTVRLRRRTPEELVEHLLVQHSFLVARVITLEEEIEHLRGRLAVVERATPWVAPPKPPAPKLPPRRSS